MTLLRIVRGASIMTLIFGMFAIVLADNLEAASTAAEAKKAMESFVSAKDAKSKAAALDSLGKLAQIQKALVEPALPDIKKALEDSSPVVRRAAAQAYGRCDPDPKVAIPLLTKMLKEDKDEDVKSGVASGLAAMGSNAKEALPAIRAEMKIQKDKQKDGKQTKLQRELGDTARAIADIKKK